jgi:hypothetical protein
MNVDRGLFLEGKVTEPGVHAPEQIGQAGLYPEVEERLRGHGIRIERTRFALRSKDGADAINE